MSEHAATISHLRKPAAANEPVILRGPWLIAGRIVWILAALGIIIVLVALVSRYRGLLLLGDPISESFNTLPRLLTYATFSRLVQWGRYAVLAVYYLTALFIFWRRSDELVSLVTSLMLLLVPFWFDLGGSISGACCEPGSPLGWVFPLAFLGGLLAIVFFNIFPSGRFAAPWMRRMFWLGVALVGIGFPLSLSLSTEALEDGSWQWLLWSILGVLIGLLGLGGAGQIYRYRRVSGPVERQQTRWVVASMALIVIWLFAVEGQTPFRSWEPWAGPWALLQIFGTLLVVALLPLSIARAITRYRLWDIDVIVRKTLVYALLTGFLLLVYFTSIVVLQGAFSRLTGQDSTLATILSTLLIAALFLPLRRRIQGVIDRRFYRRKYDAQKTLEQFAHTARDETDLEKLTDKLLRVIQETMEPEFVSIWLKPTANQRPMTADRQVPEQP